jgi:hypothetical protein
MHVLVYQQLHFTALHKLLTRQDVTQKVPSDAVALIGYGMTRYEMTRDKMTRGRNDQETK